jgi:hypothetical protein
MIFNESKTTQAAARLLKDASAPMNFMVLMKMLYLADRAAFMKHGRPITNDTYYAMFLGPVLSNTHDLATEQPSPEEDHYWGRFISPRENYEVRLTGDPGDGELSDCEVRILDAIFAKFKIYLNEPFGLPRWMHKNLPEVKEVLRGERIDLPIVEVLRGTKKSEEEISSLMDELEMLNQVDELFAVH